MFNSFLIPSEVVDTQFVRGTKRDDYGSPRAIRLLVLRSEPYFQLVIQVRVTNVYAEVQ